MKALGKKPLPRWARVLLGTLSVLFALSLGTLGILLQSFGICGPRPEIKALGALALVAALAVLMATVRWLVKGPTNSSGVPSLLDEEH